MNGPTAYIESNALLALQAGDVEEAQRLVADLLPGELRDLQDAAAELDSMCGLRLRELDGERL